MATPAKRILNNWTDSQRTVLHLLNTQFSFDAATRTRVFNIIFKDDLQKVGLGDGLGDISLESQYRDSTRKDRMHLWTNVLRDPRTDEEQEQRQGLIGQIHDAAAVLGISTEDGARHSGMEEYPAARGSDSDDGENSETSEASEKGVLSDRPSKESFLDMIHQKDLSWTPNGPAVDSFDGLLIANSSAIYKHGGQVHRIATISNKSKADFMVCDATICTHCSYSADSTLPSPTDGLPFVHSSDTIMYAKQTYFQPKYKMHSSERPKPFRRFIHFKGVDGVIKCWARICGNIGCNVCMRERTSRGIRDYARGKG